MWFSIMLLLVSMKYAALFSGVLMGLAYLRRPKTFDWVIMYFVFYKYRNRNKFYQLFDHLKKDIVMDYIEDHGLAYNYSDYLNIHKEIRPSAYEKAMYYYGQIAAMVILRIFPICILPAIIFLSNWYMYVAGVLLIALLTILYIFFVEPGKITMRREVVVMVVIDEYIKEKRMKQTNDSEL